MQVALSEPVQLRLQHVSQADILSEGPPGPLTIHVLAQPGQLVAKAAVVSPKVRVKIRAARSGVLENESRFPFIVFSSIELWGASGYIPDAGNFVCATVTSDIYK